MDISDQRVIFSDNGVLTDHTVALSQYRSDPVSLSMVAAEDYIYIGSVFPFNHKHFEIQTANATVTTLSFEIWYNKEWTPTTDLMDLTSVGGATMAQSGVVRFSPLYDKSWVKEQYSYEVEGLESSAGILEIYNMYWSRVKISNDATLSLKYLGHKFSDDQDLFTYYPDLNQTALLTSFATGKTSWDDQHFIASDIIIRDLKRSYALLSGDQILDHSLFNEASCHKTAEIIYAAFGEAYSPNTIAAAGRYKAALDVGFPKLDVNSNGKLDLGERAISIGFMRR